MNNQYLLGDEGTSNAIYIIRILFERVLEVQKDLYICFINYTNTFDRSSCRNKKNTG